MKYRELPTERDEKDAYLILKKIFTKTKSGYPRWSAVVRKAPMYGRKGRDVQCYVCYKHNEKSWWESSSVDIPLDLLPLILDVFSAPLKKEL
jgi:hypothetical protein